MHKKEEKRNKLRSILNPDLLIISFRCTSKNKKIYPKMLVPKNVQYCRLNCERRQISKCLDVMKKKYLTDFYFKCEIKNKQPFENM
jgi:hypothetical protein